MIRPVEDIPMNKRAEWRGYRARIREDIESAVSQDITQFEFIGDYNFKTLPQTAREEAFKYTADKQREWLRTLPKRETGHVYNLYKNKDSRYLTIIARKQADGLYRVYCRIDEKAFIYWKEQVQNEEDRLADKAREAQNEKAE